MLVADFVEDTNGNLLTISNPQQTAQQGGAFTVSDTLGRTLLSSSGLGTTGNTISVAGLPNPYTFTWTTAAVNFSTTWTNTKRNAAYGCRAPNTSFSTSYSEVQVITLPNGKQYTFTYDPTYGTLSQITYPIGGWIRYTWGLNLQSENAYTLNGKGQLDGTCAYRFDIPALATRQVSFDGQTIALQQDFTYVTNWNATDPTKWDTKQTTVTTHDLITGQVYQTVYSYSSFGITYYGFNQIALRNLVPLEASTAYKDTAGATLKTVNKTWYDQYMLKSESTTLDNGLTSQVTYTYSSAGAQITEKDEYDFGQTTPTRKTIHNYQSFANSPTLSAGASVFDRPCQMIVYDSSGNRVAETDYYYDGSTGATPCSTAATQSLPGTGNYTSHDETLYGPASTAPRGNLTTVVKQCFQAAQTCPSGNPSSSYSYDETGQLLTATDALGHSTTYSYADRFTDTTPPGVTNAYLTTITRPATNGVAHVQNFSYAYSDGQLTISADENSLQTTYAYNDSLRRLTETDSPNGGQILISYNDAPLSPSVTTSKKVNSSQTLTAVKASDGLGNVKQTQITSDPQGTVLKDTTYDGVGRVRTVSNPYRSGNDPTSSPGTTTYAYDPLGRKTSETYPDNSVTTTLYFGNAVTVTDATGKARKSISDAFARVTQVFEAPSGPNYETDYTYDALGNLKQVVQNGSHQRNFVYDSLSRLLTSTNPEVGTITYTYDANSNVASKADARNIVITYGYDALNRETSRTYSNGDASVLTTYDQSNCLGLSACQNVGHRTGMTDAAGSDAWSYQVDSANSRSIHREQRTTNGITKTSSYYLDLAGNVTQAVYPTGRVVNYAYDAANRPSAATDGSNGITYATDFQTVPSGCLSGAVCYTPQGTFYALSIGQSSSFTGLSLIHTYNNRLQPQEFKASSSGGYAIDISYNFVDPVSSHNAGHVYGINNNLDTTRSQTFTYDSLNRITGAQTTSTYATSPTHCWGETYSLDAWGNLNSIAGTTNSAYTGCIQESGFSTTADGNNHLPLFSYDPSGNTQNDGSHGYTWNAESQLVQSSPGRLTFTTYGYDGDGRRVSKTRFKTYWYGSGGDILAETDGSGNTTAEYIFFGGKRIAMLPASGSPLYYVEDMLGTSRVNTTNTGAVCYDADFYPYGGETAYTNTCSSPQNYKFEGKERDGETGNDNFGARYYSNRFGRWLSADWSAVPVSVPYANLSNPQTLNLYAMVADDPESFSDLDGHQNNPTPTSNQTLAAAGEACATGSGGNNQHCVTTTEKAQNQRPSLTPEQMREAILNVVGLFTFTALEAASMGGGNSGSTASRQETAAAEIAAETGAETAAARANAIADTYVGKTKGSITIAVTETAEGPRIVSSSENDRGLRPLALAALKQGEIPVEGVGHAEKTGLDAAKRMGLTPTGTAASRPICQECWDAMKALGVAALSVLKSGVI